MLVYIYLALAVIASVCTVLGFGLNFWFIPLFAVLFFIVINGIYIGALFIISLFLPKDDSKKYDVPLVRKAVFVTMDWILKISRVKVVTNGFEKLPEGKFVIISNHLSKYDPIASYVYIKNRKLTFISKKENLEIPLVGNYIRLAGFLPLDRDNPLRAMRTVRKAADMIKENGYSFGIYPEGTRSTTGELLPFKTGAFVVAQKANVPIVVSTTVGTDEVKHRSPLKSTTVTLNVLDVIPAEKVTSLKAEELSEMCYGMMKKALSK